MDQAVGPKICHVIDIQLQGDAAGAAAAAAATSSNCVVCSTEPSPEWVAIGSPCGHRVAVCSACIIPLRRRRTSDNGVDAAGAALCTLCGARGRRRLGGLPLSRGPVPRREGKNLLRRRRPRRAHGGGGDDLGWPRRQVLVPRLHGDLLRPQEALQGNEG